MNSLCLGILAHVDAGKTSLTERLLYAAGVIDEIGSVDDGTTQTDTLAQERQRGLTIKSAVVSFEVGNTTVNLIDTPGHPEFIAEVERVLCVLDGAVLVVSAVEGVQAQTRVLMRTLQRLRIPTVIFVNKIDRAGAQYERTLKELSEKLTPAIIAMGSVRNLGEKRDADSTPYGSCDADFVNVLSEVLAERDDAVLNSLLEDDVDLSYSRLLCELTAQTKKALLYPVFFGSAITGAGVGPLTTGITELLPAAEGDVAGPVSGAVFKVERGQASEKIAYVRLFSGRLRIRDRVRIGCDRERKVTGISVFERGSSNSSPSMVAGQIGKVWGLSDVQVGDGIGAASSLPAGAVAHEQQGSGYHTQLIAPVTDRRGAGRQFAPPTLETVIVPRRGGDGGRLHFALTQLAEQDPLINLRQDGSRQELSLSLYGEVQKEVIQETLASDYRVEVEFRESTTICIERPVGSGAAHEIIGKTPNQFAATVGLRVDPAPTGSRVAFRLEVELGSIPLSFHKAVEDTVRETLSQGLYGWEVTDCRVTMTHSGYWSPVSTAGDFRNLTPLVLMDALKRADTTVFEPMHRFRLEMPGDSYGPTVAALSRLEAAVCDATMLGSAWTLEGEIPAARVHELQQMLPGLTSGEGVVQCEFGRYRRIRGTPPTRSRSDQNPLNRKEYFLHVRRRV